MSDIDATRTEALAALEAVSDAAGLEAWRLTYLGKKGRVKALMKRLRDIPNEEKRAFGQGVNALEEALAEGGMNVGNPSREELMQLPLGSLAEPPLRARPACVVAKCPPKGSLELTLWLMGLGQDRRRNRRPSFEPAPLEVSSIAVQSPLMNRVAPLRIGFMEERAVGLIPARLG